MTDTTLRKDLMRVLTEHHPGAVAYPIQDLEKVVERHTQEARIEELVSLMGEHQTSMLDKKDAEVTTSVVPIADIHRRIQALTKKGSTDG